MTAKKQITSANVNHSIDSSVKTDCRHYQGDRPCVYHKERGTHCGNCSHYDSIKTRILIIKLNAMGDVLRTAGIIQALRSKYPSAYITWITDPESVPLLELVPGIDRIWSHDGLLIERLLVEAFDLALGLDNAQASASLTYLAKAEIKKGFSLDACGHLLPLSPTAEMWLQMGIWDDLKRANRRTYQDILWDICELPPPTMPPDIVLPGVSKNEAWNFAKEVRMDDTKPVIGFFSGSGKRWPQKALSFAKQKELLETLAAYYPQYSIILFGGPNEAEHNKHLLADAPHNILRSGWHNTLAKFASLLNLVDVLITGDTLALQVGLALRKKIVAYFGPTAPWEVDLFGMGTKIVAPVECIACYRSSCNKAQKCSDLIAVNDIVDAVSNLMNNNFNMSKNNKTTIP